MAESHNQSYHIKCVLLGDNGTGKTCAIQTLKFGSFPSEYIPTIADYQAHEFVLTEAGGEIKVQMDYWETVEGNEDYERLRPLAYPQTDIFLLCFSIISPVSLSRIRTIYLPEIRKHCPDAPYLLVGLKGDLREDWNKDEEFKRKVEKKEIEFVSQEAARALAKETGAASEYIECSSLTKDNLQHMFEEVARAAIRNKQKPIVEEKKRKKSCIIL